MPSGMSSERAHAAATRLRAEVAACADSVARVTTTAAEVAACWTGPAAGEFQTALAGWRAHAAALVRHLDDLSAGLRASAADYAQVEQAALRRAMAGPR